MPPNKTPSPQQKGETILFEFTRLRRMGALAMTAVLLCMLGACGKQPQKDPAQDFTGVPSSSALPQSTLPPANPADALKYRAVWISYLEWANFDTTSEAAFTQSVAAMLDNCVSLGLNCIILQVRPFSDAIYPSEMFPWSHIVTGTQGQDPGFDPLAIFVEQAHARALALEAWVNPYRVRLGETLPKGELAAQNPAVLHPEWAVEAEGGLYLQPANPDAQQYIVDGVVELLQRYDVDGIQFDDYFYPTTDAAFDAALYAAQGNGKPLEEWRRENVNTLVRRVYEAVKQTKPDVIFGISPQGNNDQNYNTQYSDVGLWLSSPGYVDYIMPQVYWGYGYTLKNGSTRFAFENIVAEWAAMPRDASVSLAMGLGAYRVGPGDGGANDQSQWQSGHNLADMVKTLQQTSGIGGFALYRYDSLFRAGEHEALAVQEQEALRTLVSGVAQ